MAAPLTHDIQSLLRRLRSNRRVEQLQAATELAGFVRRSSAEQRTALVAAGCVPPLLQVLCSSSSAVQAQAAAALAILTEGGLSPAALAAVSDGGGIAALVPLLGSSNETVLANAAALLGSLANGSDEDATSIEAAGCMPILLRLLSSSNSQVQLSAAGAICGLSSKAPVRAALAADGAIPALVRLLHDSGASDLALESAVLALGNLMLQNSERQAAAVAAGAPAALVRVLRSSPEAAVDAAAAKAIWYLLEEHGGDSAACAAVAEAGAIEALAERLSERVSTAWLEFACRVLACLALRSTEHCRAIVATGCVPRLVQLLGGGEGAAEQLAAAAVLGSLSTDPSAAASSTLVAASAVPQLVAVLRSCDVAVTLVCAADTLHNLACNGYAEAAVAADAVPALQQLQHSREEGVRQASSNALSELLSAARSGSSVQPQASQPASDAVAAAALASQQRPPRVCAAPGCGTTAGLRRCGGCGSVRYCSEACSRAHWRAHKAECRRLQAERAAAEP